MELTANYCIEVAKKFVTDGTPVLAEPFGGGHINNTFLIKTDKGTKYTLQRINTNVFKKPDQVMSNICEVLEHIENKLAQMKDNTVQKCLTVVKTKDGKNHFVSEENEHFRLYTFIEGMVYNKAEKPEHLYLAAKAFGTFQNMLSDFPADKLYETIENFHNTIWRFENLEKAIAQDKCGRLANVQKEVEFALARKQEAGKIVNALAKQEIPLRVTHNDTKLNNVLLDEKDNFIAVIDLDTVMPGSMLYDYGDSIRFGATYAAEDEKDLSKVKVEFELFEAYTKGFLEALGDRITEKEVELLVFGAKTMTLECGIRFLTDYLEGDTYFKIHYDGHNLDRARTQLKLVEDMENKWDELEAIVKKYYNK